ncbi:unnamed protein product [Rotaria sp. Silwood2]|nr:unnamed protein product [Rotaria sp. Silwood2]CAF2586186.1 unnamed protein product [Rotaria sp. Silwood2]CAF2851841.1 unnamed protein product [Rotaria sp. Silwood2]CAF2998444.1 unnamed protein product [Rotaria sp. Silwood2]CAF3976176.1 unnamed protein product [Rotaria sp. Silwood2]
MKETTIFPTETTAVLNTTTMEYEEEITITTTPTKSLEYNKSYEFQSNFSRNNDSVFVSIHSNASDTFVWINNTFTNSKYDNYPCEILFYEHWHNLNQMLKTKIIIDFNRSFSRDLAIQLGDRLMDIADLLSTIRSIDNRNNTLETDD